MRASNLPNPGKLQSSQRLRREVALAVSDIEQSPSVDRKTELANFFSEVAGYLGGTVTPVEPGVSYPKSTSRKYGTMGDSRLGISLYTGGRNQFFKSFGLASWLDSASNGRIVLEPNAHTAISGTNTTEMVARLDSDIAKIKAAGVTHVFFIGGTNDYSASIEPATTQANILTIVSRAQAAGLTVIAIAETPRRAGDTEDVKNKHYALRKWYMTILAEKCWVVDVWKDLCDPVDPRVMAAGVTYDGQHGGPAWQKVFGNRLFHETSHVWPATQLTELATRSLTPNPTLTGNTGKIASTATNTTGQLATGFTLEGGALDGLTCVASVKESQDGGQYQVLRITGTPTAAENSYSFYVEPSATPVQGTKVKGLCELNWVATNMLQCSLNLLAFPKYFSKVDGDTNGSGDATIVMPTAHVGSKETTELLIESDANAYRLYVSITFKPNVAVDATIVIGRMGVLPA